MFRALLVAALALVCVASNAEARQRHKSGLHPECFISMPCIAPYASTPDQVRVARGRYVARQVGFGAAIEKPVRRARVSHVDYRHVIRTKPAVKTVPIPAPRIATEIVAHPDNCPRRLFCGCGAAERLKKVWGIIVEKPRELWLAANWYRYPRAQAAPGMIAVRRHHVYVIEADLGGGKVLAYDANSGGGKTRIHIRSLAGYAVVNPRGVT